MQEPQSEAPLKKLSPATIIWSQLAALTILVQSSSATVSSEGWKTVARAAHHNLADKKFSEAAAGFEKVSSMLEQTTPPPEALYDIQLLLAETYRQAGDTARASDILNSIEPLLTTHKFLDPTFAVRYWRRRGDLEGTIGNTRMAIRSYRKVTSILERYFEPGGRALHLSYRKLVDMLVKEQDWSETCKILEKLTRFSKTIRNKPHLDRARFDCLSIVSKPAAELMRTGKLNDGAYLLMSCGDPIINNLQKDQIYTQVDIWVDYLNVCASLKRYHDIDPVIDKLNLLLGVIASWPTTEKTIRTQLVAHETIYSTLNKMPRREEKRLKSETSKIVQLVDALGVKANFDIKCHRYLLGCNLHRWDEKDRDFKQLQKTLS
ncbi:MAG: hypothetical protein K2Z81_16425, partial [Cyanobacteria bacterium]|nr:hypothetical protein [Cyanobacteriota bacterium]